MSLRDELLKVVKNENKKDPLTDVKLAKILSTTREVITSLRKELNIPESRERRRPYLEQEIKELLKQNNKKNVTELTKELMKRGFDISRYVVEKIIKDMDKKENKTDVEDLMHDPFKVLIGYNGSLNANIMQAKAAVLYPPFGLSTLITGESGTGKTHFAECMYYFAKQSEVLKEDAPFVAFNCADYSDNPQLLLSLLYGYKKGAFTGAEEDTEGIVEQANNGVLFLDEIHRLPSKGQEILFSLLDKGKFRRLGETSNERKVKIIFIGATTENIESNLLLTFRRRIPMVIAIPPLHERPLLEIIELIRCFFQQECNNINSKIFVESKVIEILALKKYQGNIGQLRNEIQVACARAFMKQINKTNDIITVDFNDILETTNFERDFIIEDKNLIQVKNHVKDMLLVPFINDKLVIASAKEDEYSLPEDFYDQIERKFYELKNLKMDPQNIEEILWTFIINKFNKLVPGIRTDKVSYSLDELVNVVDKDIINMVKQLKIQLKKHYPYCSVNENVFTYLAIHLEQTIKRLYLKQQIINPNLLKIKKDFSDEYNLALSFSKMLEQNKNLAIPDDETGFIAMYIKTALENKPLKNRIGLVVLSHGRIATEIINVVKKLLNITFPVAIDMPLDENPTIIYDKTIEMAKVVDEGRGILFLVDMGSLVNIGNIVSDKLGIKTRTIDRVDLITVLEAARKISMYEDDLDEIYASLISQKYNFSFLGISGTDMPVAIITTCLTGKGTATYIKECLEKRYGNITIIPLGIFDDEFSNKMQELKQKYQIVAVIGTINPEVEGLNFIPFEPNLLNKEIKTLDMLLCKRRINKLENFLEDDLILIDPAIKSKTDLIEIMCSLLVNKGYVKKDFINSVLNREKIAPTFFKGGIALPHAEPGEVIHSSVAIAKLKESIDWDIGKVSFVCLPALKYNDKKIITKILKPLSDTDIADRLKKTKFAIDFKKIILASFKEDK